MMVDVGLSRGMRVTETEYRYCCYTIHELLNEGVVFAGGSLLLGEYC
jgi:hypothetical protein